MPQQKVAPRGTELQVFGEDVKPGAFAQEDEEGPTESDWILVGQRRYKVLAVPSKLPTFVPEFCWGSIPGLLVGLVIYLVAERRSQTWAARVYWQKNRRMAVRYHWWLQQEFGSMDEAKAEVAELVQALQAGVVPDPVPRS
ncbi:hypothetical protein BJ986_001670 [Phycicoccus badiiscoriae]|uniref:Uncharacterized protein n=1 Tax=Pedococcus badiiscoriae TaxID=642776 RepID=A0A852WDD2_9MICO|nr:hypothetical protein [Pedococcus badiiscoriae]NYG07183.1 hypothetical protein [Pedococcus badiiscoriae]